VTGIPHDYVEVRTLAPYPEKATMSLNFKISAILGLLLTTPLASASLLNHSEVKCGPVVSFQRADLKEVGPIHLRLVYREIRNPYTRFRKVRANQTIAFETFPNGQRVSGFLDFYQFDADRLPIIFLDGEYLVIRHKYGTHMVPIDSLYTFPSPTFEATRFYNSENACK
jgi:hypothetical protein